MSDILGAERALAYIEEYGSERYLSELAEYEKITGENWAALLSEIREENPDYTVEEFHHDVILKTINPVSRERFS